MIMARLLHDLLYVIAAARRLARQLRQARLRVCDDV